MQIVQYKKRCEDVILHGGMNTWKMSHRQSYDCQGFLLILHWLVSGKWNFMFDNRENTDTFDEFVDLHLFVMFQNAIQTMLVFVS